MKAIIEIDCDNAVFEGDPRPELARILTQLVTNMDAERFINFHPNNHGRVLRDSNGNRVGLFAFELEE